MSRQHSAKADAKRADTQELRDRALELRKRGANYRQIAKALGVSVGRTHTLVQEAIAAIPKENAQAVLAIELEKLDLLEASLMPLATKGDYLAAGAIIKVMDRRARYLGLNAPEKRELTGEGGGPIAFAPVIMIPPERTEAPPASQTAELHASKAAAPAGLAPESGTAD